MEKWSSRKLWLTGVVIGILSLLPVLYKSLSIGDNVALAVITAIGAASGVYNISNAISKRGGEE